MSKDPSVQALHALGLRFLGLGLFGLGCGCGASGCRAVELYGSGH